MVQWICEFIQHKTCAHGLKIEKGKYSGTYKTVGDRERAEIIKLYIDEGLSMNKIGEKLGRSSRVS